MSRPRGWIRLHWLPLVVLLLWIAASPLGIFASKLAQVQENDNAAFLPESAESTVALERFAQFAGEESTPTTVVFEREGGLTPPDHAAIAGYAEELRRLERVDAERVAGPIRAEDGEAAQIVAPIAASDGEAVTATVEAMERLVSDAPEGITVLVGGQGAILSDFIVAFGAIDGLLLGVALLVVLAILLVVYRTPVLPVIVLACAVLALGIASAAIYALADADVLDVNGQSQGILFILAVGAATDYSLLIVARYREELRDQESKFAAMRVAYRASVEPIVASGITVILGLLCLLLSDLSSLSGLGPVGAFGIAAAMLSSLTLLPALLLLLGRRSFWPFQPRRGSEHTDTRGVWGRVARLVGRRARTVWVATVVVLAACAVFVPTLDEDPVPQTEVFLTEVDSVRAQEILDEHFDSDQSSPVIVVAPQEQLRGTVELLSGHEGIAPDGVAPVPDGQSLPGLPVQPRVVDGDVIVLATLTHGAETAAANDTVRDLRSDLDEVSEDILVGGTTAILLDSRDTTERDRARVIPAILLVILLVLALLLRSLVAPLILLVANVLSFGATLGISALLFQHVFDFPATDPTISLIGFVFLVALGIDYSIFLMTRVREESIRQGTHPGVLKGLSVTGGVITSAGVVLAATFTALSVIPLLFLVQIAFIVAFGVLLDTFVVRSLLVPALSYDLGARIWWPSKLWHTPDHADPTTSDLLHLGEDDGVRM